MQLTLTNHPYNKSEVLNKFKYGQYFTKTKIVERVLKLILEFKKHNHDASILEPSFGTGNFIQVLSENNFKNVMGCEIDSSLTDKPIDFFEYSLSNKFDMIIGNPPFTKYNVPESYYYPERYKKSSISPSLYLTTQLIKKEKEKIENVFILKCLGHLKNKNSSIAFVLPISFFIKNRNKEIKKKILEKFSTIIIFQNKDVWFDYHITCCFAIFTNLEDYKDKVILQFENGKTHRHILPISEFYEELIPEVIFNKKNGLATQTRGDKLENYLSMYKIKCRKSFDEYNVSGKNILSKTKIPNNSNASNYKLAVVRVGNGSVGKCGLININEDITNDMFFIFDFKEEYNNDKKLKEKICEQINNHQDFFKNITFRVGSKSIKKENIYNFRVEINQNID